MAVVLPEPETPLIRITRMFFTPPRPALKFTPFLLHLAKEPFLKLKGRIVTHPLEEVIPGSHLDDRRKITARGHRDFQHGKFHPQEGILFLLQSHTVILHLGIPFHQLDDQFNPFPFPNGFDPEELTDIDDAQSPDFHMVLDHIEPASEQRGRQPFSESKPYRPRPAGGPEG